jgi:hypothetical protein
MKYKTLQRSNDLFIQFDEEDIAKLNLEEGDKFSISIEEDGIFKLDKLVPLELDLSEFPRDTLEQLIIQSAEKDLSVNEIFTEWLEFICNDLRKEHPELETNEPQKA